MPPVYLPIPNAIQHSGYLSTISLSTDGNLYADSNITRAAKPRLQSKPKKEHREANRGS